MEKKWWIWGIKAKRDLTQTKQWAWDAVGEIGQPGWMGANVEKKAKLYKSIE